jgi:hypothetical protein
MKMNDVGKPGFGNSKNTYFNPFYERLLADNQQDVSYINYVKAAKFDFFTCEFGLNDVLDYAQAGGTKIMTPIETFAISCRQIFEVLGEKKVKGLVLSIPNIEQMPHFVKVGSLKTTIYITSAGNVRKATDQEIVMLPVVEQMSKNGNQYGLSQANPLKNEDVLDASELNRLRQNISDLNTVLNVEAKRQNLTVLDINPLLANISNGSFSEKGVAVKGDISNSGFYSVDGIYPTSKGAAILANEIIKSLNVEMKANKQKEIPSLDFTKLKGVEVK